MAELGNTDPSALVLDEDREVFPVLEPEAAPEDVPVTTASDPGVAPPLVSFAPLVSEQSEPTEEKTEEPAEEASEVPLDPARAAEVQSAVSARRQVKAARRRQVNARYERKREALRQDPFAWP